MAFTLSPATPVARESFHALWQELEAHHQQIKSLHLREFFQEDGERFQKFFRSFEEIGVDFCKNHLTLETLSLLTRLAQAAGLEEARRMLFQGEAINWTEKTAALHTALRQQATTEVLVNGHNVMPEIVAARQQLQAFSQRVQDGKLTGARGEKITTLVHIGIGGSYLGPKLLVEALAPHALADAPQIRFISNIDGDDFVQATKGLNPHTTLFILASKSCATPETTLNGRTAWQWLAQAMDDPQEVARHFLAVTANRQAALHFGIPGEAVFPGWRWLNGRYSWPSAISLPVVALIGYDAFAQVLAGAHAMDQHFQNAPLDDNLPVLLAMISVWYTNFFHMPSHLLLPYSHLLRSFPEYYQQCEMESNGKTARRDNTPSPVATGQIIWGQAGTNGQHSFYQLLHQGSHTFTADFIAVLQPGHTLHHHHRELLANCFAQSEALMVGRTSEEVRQKLLARGISPKEVEILLPQRIFPGNHPSNTILLDRLTPYNLGALLSLYEMKTFVMGVVWGINSFDQWGVELGKELARGIGQHQESLLAGNALDSRACHPATAGLLHHWANRHPEKD
ncbi:MAG: glucose-6-phosphate isomerase [Magnetococcales bacterium]|nr:glucose-6-phosphate isomerase [Magnetococcales bacterium]